MITRDPKIILLGGIKHFLIAVNHLIALLLFILSQSNNEEYLTEYLHYCNVQQILLHNFNTTLRVSIIVTCGPLIFK